MIYYLFLLMFSNLLWTKCTGASLLNRQTPKILPLRAEKTVLGQ